MCYKKQLDEDLLNEIDTLEAAINRYETILAAKTDEPERDNITKFIKYFKEEKTKKIKKRRDMRIRAVR